MLVITYKTDHVKKNNEGKFIYTHLFNDIVVVAACLCLWMLHTTSVELNKYVNATICVEPGRDLLDISCGKVQEKITSIEWFMKTSERKRILKYYFKPEKRLLYYNKYGRDKYDIRVSANTSLVVKNIVPSDTGVFICTANGETMNYSYTTLLTNMGKSLLSMVF